MGNPLSEPIELPVVGQRSPERSDAAENRIRILAAARRLLLEQGGGEISMDAVAAAAGVGKGTVFRHFGNRRGLMEAIIDEHMRDLQDSFISGPPPLGPGAPPAERLEAFVVELVRRQLGDIEFVLAAEGRPGLPPSAAFGTLLLHLVNLLREIDPGLDGEVVGSMILSTVSPPLLYRLRDRGQNDLESAARRVLRGVIPT